ncbi:MAG: sodium-dependent bicarbonate transport family permease [Alphaproteobacteria bacterium]|nr:sodium-dependent bicarbonate transport family permease [Alphaproteobacteria bacterium]
MDSILLENLISPITLAFLMGIVATLIRSDLEIPEPVIRIFAIFLLFSIGLQGGRELQTVELSNVMGAVAVTAAIVLLIPLMAFLVARHVIKLSIVDAAGVAALYGSVSSVTSVVARAYAEAAGFPMEGYVTGLVALMELGILAALFYGRVALSQSAAAGGAAQKTALGAILMETLRGRGLLLLGGVLIIGGLSGEANFSKIEPFFVDLFRGVLVLFLLEMGMTAGRQLTGFARVGGRILAFGVVMPLVNGFVVSGLATFAGLPMGSAFVLGVVAASASYIDAPAAVRATFPEANPSVYLTASLGITFPFMLILGVPMVWQMTAFWQGL